MGEDEFAIKRRFFKIMLPGFEERMRLPPEFSERLKQKKSSKRAILESSRGTWEINVSRDDDGVMFFEDGWPRFVDEHELSVGDFLVFEHTQHLHFNVLVFDPTACEKESVGEPQQAEEKSKRKAEEKSQVVHSHKRPHFTLKMSPYFATKMGRATIPSEFVRSNKLEQKEMATLSVRDDRGRRRWNVKLVVENYNNNKSQIRMKGGWHDFYASNELQVGDVCLFELNPTTPASTSISFDVQIFPA